jgi:hypothetical protein
MPDQQKRKITHRSSTAMHRSLRSSRSHGPGDNAAGYLDLKIRERKARMSGYDSPQQYDITLVAGLRRPSSVDAIKMAIDRMVAQGQISEESKQRIRESGDYLPELGAVDVPSDAESDGPSY